ncbi:MBL fold metallo-hydrolase [Streptomyces gamaensis]|uniref:MBL fold metallo-hydrolase n=1 Tax=Streptomyces gamaensis TaxID=1763542 RepID=A0ABW0Z8Y8_9ACTN
MDVTRLTPRITMFTFTAGQAYALRRPDGDWTLVDTGLRGHGRAILSALSELSAEGGRLRDIFLTHSHGDHTGSAAELAALTGARVLAGAADADVIRGTAPEPPPVLEDWEVPIIESVHARLGDTVQAPPCRVDVELTDGDTLDWGEEATAVHIPGHTAGSMALHLPASGVLFTGDTIANAPELGGVILGVFNVDREQALSSFRKQAELPGLEVACFGHGAPVVGGAGEALREAVARTGR